MQDGDFDALVSGFYRAATGEQDWARSLDGVQAAFSARTAILQSVDVRTGQILSLHNGGPPMHDAMLDYVREYHHIDPRRQHMLQLGPSALGNWWHCHEHIDEAFVARDRFCQEFMPAYNTRYLSTLLVMPSEHVLTGFALELPASRAVLTADERECVRRLGVHMHDALRAYQRVRMLTAQALAGHTLLRSFTYPMWLIDTERFIHFANDAAEVETATEARMAKRGTHLFIRQPRPDRELTAQLHRMQQGTAGDVSVLRLRHSDAVSPCWLHLSKLVPETVLGAFGTRPMVLATLFDPAQVSTLDPFALGKVLGLTPAQARVAVRLAEGMTAQDIADAQGCALSTVRTHIREVLVRLGVQRIADVVRVLRQGETLWCSAAHGAE